MKVRYLTLRANENDWMFSRPWFRRGLISLGIGHVEERLPEQNVFSRDWIFLPLSEEEYRNWLKGVQEKYNPIPRKEFRPKGLTELEWIERTSRE